MGANYLHIYLYTAAFVVTAAFIGRILDCQYHSVADGISTLRVGLRRVLWFASKVLALGILAVILLALIPTGITRFFFQNRFLGALAFGSFFALLVSICVAWLLTPAGVRLIQVPHSRDVSTELIKQGRIFTVLAVLASILLSYFSTKAEVSLYASSYFNPAFIQLVIMPVISLLVALPYLSLWIALSLLAADGVQETEVKASSENGTLP